jgi:hypothetical protein
LAQGHKAHVAALDERAEDGAANIAPTWETPIQSCGWRRGAEESLICGTFLAAYVRGGSTKWGQVVTHGRLHPEWIEWIDAIDCAWAETAAHDLRAEEVANARAIIIAIVRRGPAAYASV